MNYFKQYYRNLLNFKQYYRRIIFGLSTIYISKIATDKYIRKDFFEGVGFYSLMGAILLISLLDPLLDLYLKKHYEDNELLVNQQMNL